MMRDRHGNEVPAAAEEFARFVAERDWHYLREWCEGEYEDEDGNLVEYAYWEQMIWQEKPPAWPREEGIWFWAMTCSDGMIANPNAWPVLIELAEASSEQARTSCTVPFTP